MHGVMSRKGTPLARRMSRPGATGNRNDGIALDVLFAANAILDVPLIEANLTGLPESAKA